MYGFLVALGASLCAVLRWIITQMATQKEKAGVFETILLISPSAVLAVCPLFLFNEAAALVSTEHGISSKTHEGENPWIVWIEFCAAATVGGVVSLVLVAVQVHLIRLTSSLTTDIVGKLKDVLQIIMAATVLGETIKPHNGVGVVVLLVGILCYSWFKSRYGDAASGGTCGGIYRAPPPSSSLYVWWDIRGPSSLYVCTLY